jgi:putative oxidoreductase
MKIVSTVARYLLGLLFTVMGLNGFMHFMPAPPFPPGLLLDFFTAISGSGFYIMVFGVQLICGILLLVNQYVPLAIVALAAVLVNILTLHATMNPQGFPMAIVATILWFLVAWPMRTQFSCIFARQVNA